MIEKLAFNLFTKEDSHNLMRLMDYARPYKARIICALLAIFGVAATESYLAAFIAPLVNRSFAAPSALPEPNITAGIVATLRNWKTQFTHMIWGTSNEVWAMPVFFIILVIIHGICRFVSIYLLTRMSVMAISHVRCNILNKMLLLSSKFHQETPPGTVLMSLVHMAEQSISNTSNVFIILTRDTMIVIGLVCVLLYPNWQLSLIVALMFLLLSLLSRYCRNRLKSIVASSRLSTGTISNVVNKIHQGHRVVKLFGGQRQAAERFTAIDDTIVRLDKKITQTIATRSPFSELVASFALAVIIFITLQQSQKSYTTISEFMAFIVAVLQILSPIKNLINVSVPMQTMFLASNAVYQFLDTEPGKDTGTQSLQSVSGHLKFENVDVHYHEDDKKALDGFSLDIRQGERVALVDRSGSGKSIVVNLLPRFVEPSAGTVCLDDINIANIRLTDLCIQFALVSQDVFLFDDTLLANVRYDRSEASEGKVSTALKTASLQDLVENSPYDPHQPIGTNGSQLSDERRQRVIIARAILKDAPILLLDKATNTLGNESECLVQQTLERLIENRTSIIVTRRLTTVEQADRIVVMNGDRIVEQGLHSELMAQNGYYAMLCNMPKITGQF